MLFVWFSKLFKVQRAKLLLSSDQFSSLMKVSRLSYGLLLKGSVTQSSVQHLLIYYNFKRGKINKITERIIITKIAIRHSFSTNLLEINANLYTSTVDFYIHPGFQQFKKQADVVITLAYERHSRQCLPVGKILSCRQHNFVGRIGNFH